MSHWGRAAAVAVFGLLGCGGSGGTDEGGFQPVVGAYCAPEVHSYAVQTGPTNWRITLRFNQSATQQVVDRDGFLRQQTVRSCGALILVLDNTPTGWTEWDAITAGGQIAGVNPV